MRRDNGQLGPIGLDLDAGTIRAAQVARTRAGRRVVASARIDRPDPDATIGADELRRLADALDRQGFVGRSVVVPASQTRVRRLMLDLPPAGGAVDAMLFAREEFASAHHWRPDAFELASWELPAPGAGAPRRQALVTGLLHEDAESPTLALEEAGFMVEAIDLRCWAIARALELTRDSGGVAVGLDFGWDCATLLAAHRGEIVYERSFESAGGGAMTRIATERLSVEPRLALHALRSSARGGRETPISGMLAPIVESALEALSNDLRTAIGFLDHRYDFPQPVRLFVTGPAPCELARIASCLGLEEAEPLGPPEIPGGAAEDACAIGLALWEDA